MNQVLIFILLFLLALAAISAVMIKSLIKSAILLAAASVVLAVLLFLLQSPWSAVFELSVCAGLITAVFISAVALTRDKTAEEEDTQAREHRARYIHLPLIITAAALVLLIVLTQSAPEWPVVKAAPALGFKETFWNTRQLDLLGQISILLAGVFGIIVLFKERDNK